MPVPPPGLIIAAPASRSGKTVLTLALLRWFRDAGVRVQGCKVGPDYIDPGFHAAASGRPGYNLDLWAMRPDSARAVIERLHRDADLVLCEGAMGLFDGAADGTGSTADVAALTGWPVLLVVDARGQGASVAALVGGFASHRKDVDLAGLVFNRVGSPAHAALLGEAVAPLGIPVLGAVPRNAGLLLAERYLGLVQAGEREDLEAFLAGTTQLAAEHIDAAAVRRLARPARLRGGAAAPGPGIPPLGQRIAVARDAAFSFAYPAVLDGWRDAGAALICFAPLADEPPDPDCDAVYLPGGYPELHAGALAGNARFLDGLRDAAARGTTIFGECGGYMVLGEGLADAASVRHRMAGLLPIETSFANRRLHLGYRRAVLATDCGLGRAGALFSGHEFHYATVREEGAEAPLFRCTDARGRALGACGARRGSVFGSFVHLIDGGTGEAAALDDSATGVGLPRSGKSGIFSQPDPFGPTWGSNDAESRANVGG